MNNYYLKKLHTFAEHKVAQIIIIGQLRITNNSSFKNENNISAFYFYNRTFPHPGNSLVRT